MTFVQIIDCRTDRFDEMNRLMDDWAEQTKGKRTATHETIARDREDGGHYVEIVEFPSYAEAMRNSRLPETDRAFQRIVDLCESPPTFTNLDVLREDNFDKQAARRFYDEVAERGNLDVIDEVYWPDLIDHDVGKDTDTTVGSDVLKQTVSAWREAFDITFDIDGQVSEGDTVVTRWTWRGVHRGPFMGVEPTGREYTMTGMTACRFRDGKVQESWWYYDLLRLARELEPA